MHEGLVLSDRFEVVRKLGQGGMGAVWEGRDRLLGRRVAIKTLAVNPSADAARRFRGEAQIGAALSHPGITVVYDIGEYDQALFLVMEHLEGRDLKDLLEKDGPLPIGRAVELSIELLKALGAAHAQGVVHRDIKPGNVMVLGNGQLKILDFGIARFTDATMTGSVVGTPGYMAPEQFSSAHEVDARCDLYSFGIVLYELLTGRLPFACDTMPQFIYAHLQRVPDPPRLTRPEIPEALDRLILDLLAKAPADRPASAEATIARLEQVRSAPSGPRTPTPQPFRAPVRQGPGTNPPFAAQQRQDAPLPFSWSSGEQQAPVTPHGFHQPGFQAAAQQYAPTQPPYQAAPQYGQQAAYPYGQVPALPGGDAAWWRRMLAFGIDWFLAFMIVIVAVALMGIDDPTSQDELTDTEGFAMLAIWAIVYLGFGLMEGLIGYGPGKGALMIRVADARSGERLGALRGVLRCYAQILNWWTCFVGYFWPLWDPKKQTFADKACRARVLNRR